ncbi:uncharacterized protein [Amphiura filiformis]|uniref:uncharacterized protein n=1 Tax=Amphiura filiformis TaxID=82378 RepID=UPI003B20E5EC
MKSLLVLLAFVICGVTGVHCSDDSLWMKFVFTFPHNPFGGIPRVFITTEVNHPVMVSVSVPGIGFISSTNVTQNQGATLDLPVDAGITDSSSIKETKKTVIVIATDDVSVRGYYYAPLVSHDGWFVLPTSALGKDYVAVGYDSKGTFYFSEFVVTAIEDDTLVHIKGHIELSMILHQYESYQFVSDSVNQPDITGMSIKADKPVSVMSGHQCAYVPVNILGCDYIMEHLPPVSILGHHYILAPFLGRTSGFVYRVVCTSPGATNVSISGETISVSNGGFYEGDFVTTDEVLTVMADNPIMVVQYAKGVISDGVGDPFMLVIPSTQRFSNNVTFPSGTLMDSMDSIHFISIITPECDSINSFNLDGVPLNRQTIGFLETFGGVFCVLYTPISADLHSVTHPSASFIVLVYGFGYYVSYGFVARYQVHTDSMDVAVSTPTNAISSATNPPPSPPATYVIAAVTTGVIVIILVASICVVVCYCRRRENIDQIGEQENASNKEVHLNPTFESTVPHDDPSPNLSDICMETRLQDNGDYLEPMPHLRPVEAPVMTLDRLQFMKELGSGQYGIVWLAETQMITRNGVVTKVAVKTTKEDAPTSEKEDLQREMNLMKRFQLHPNVLEFLGSCVDRDSLYVILEYMAKGTLRQVLKNSRRLYDYAYTTVRDTQSSLSQTQLMIFAQQVASGMDFITSNKCVHRDLATRNVLVSEDLVCKVSDFGLAREEEEYHRKSNIKLPIRWMSVESLADDVHTKESDVWSFGILLWEIITLGARPYPGMGTRAVIREVQQGFRMPKPVHCTQDLYDIMSACWSSNPHDRPSFAEIIRNIDRIIAMKSDCLLLDDIDEDIYDDTAVIDEDEKV